jgi:hypothetical protein
LHAEHFWCFQVKLPNLKMKTRPKQFLGYLPLVIALPALDEFCGKIIFDDSAFFGLPRLKRASLISVGKRK